MCCCCGGAAGLLSGLGIWKSGEQESIHRAVTELLLPNLESS